jgi:polyhydroxyalkanoate synthase
MIKMATEEHDTDQYEGEAQDRMTANLARVETLSQRLIAALSRRNPANPALNAPSHDLFAKAAAAYWSEALENPARLYENQLAYWGQSVRQFMQAQQSMMTGVPASEEDTPRDKRFANPLWPRILIFAISASSTN